MTELTDTGAGLTVLLPVRTFEGEQVPAALVELLTSASIPVVLLGYHVIPEQTAPEQAREQFGEQARAELDDLADAFREAGGTVETRFVFTRDPTQTFERVAVDERADAILLLNPAPNVDRIFVAISEGINTDRITAFTAALAVGSDVTVTLVHVADSEEARPAGERLLEEVADALSANGVPPGAIERAVTVSQAPLQALNEMASDDTDLVVLGESQPTVRELVFGEPSERIAERTLAPVLVVRRLPAAESADAAAEESDDE
jgi:nucleotide-binding universal stress UspA family protein